MFKSIKNGKESFTIFDPTNFVIEELDIESIDYEREGTAMDLRWNLTDYNYFSDKSEEEILQDLKRETKIQFALGHAEHKPLDKRTMELIMKYSISQCEKEKEKILDFYNSSKRCRKFINEGIKGCIEINKKFSEER